MRPRPPLVRHSFHIRNGCSTRQPAAATAVTTVTRSGTRPDLPARTRRARATPRRPAPATRRRRRRCRRTHVAIVRRCSSVACWAMRRLGVGSLRRPAPRAAPAAPPAAPPPRSHPGTARGSSTPPATGRRARRPHPSGAAATWRRNSSPIAGWVIASSASRDSCRRRPADASFARSRRPSASTTSAPKRSASFSSTGEPGSTTWRAMRSASTTTAPLATRRAATVDLPDPIPPVRPIICTAPEFHYFWSGSQARPPRRGMGARRVACSLRSPLSQSSA